MEEVERENESLRRRIDLLERDLQSRSPTKKQRTMMRGASKGPAMDSSVVIMGEGTANASPSSKSPPKVTRMTRSRVISSTVETPSTCEGIESSMRAMKGLSLRDDQRIDWPLKTPLRKAAEKRVADEGESSLEESTLTMMTAHEDQSLLTPTQTPKKATSAVAPGSDGARAASSGSIIMDETTLRASTGNNSATKTPRTTGRKMRYVSPPPPPLLLSSVLAS